MPRRLHFDAARAGKVAVVSLDQLACSTDVKQKIDAPFTALLDPPVDEGGKMLRVFAFDVEGIGNGPTNMGLAPESADLNKSLKRQSALCYTQDATDPRGGDPAGVIYLDGKAYGRRQEGVSSGDLYGQSTGKWTHSGVMPRHVHGGVLIVWTKDDAGVCRARLHVGFERIGKGPGSEVPAAYNRFAVSLGSIRSCKFILFPELAAEAEAALKDGEEGFEAWLKQKRAGMSKVEAAEVACCLIA